MVVTLDCESTTIAKGNPFTASNKMVSYSLQVGENDPQFSYYTAIDFLSALKENLPKTKLLIGFNIKYDLNVIRRYGLLPPEGVRVWDCQIAEFIITGQQHRYPSLNECLAKYDLGQKDDKIAEYWALGVDTTDIPIDELEHYNKLDVALTYKLYQKQQELMTDRQKKLCMIMGLDLLVLAEMEWNGIKFDIELCRKKADETKIALSTINEELAAYAKCPHFNWDSGHHLSCFLYGGAFAVTIPERTETLVYKSGKRKGEEYEKTHWRTVLYTFERLFVPSERNKTKLESKTEIGVFPIYATGEDVLKQLKRPTKAHKRIIELLLERAEKAKLLDTYYGKLPELLETMEWGEYLHGSYNQCVAATGRLSSSNP